MRKTQAQVFGETVSKVDRDATPCSNDLPNVTYTMNYSYPGSFEDQSFFSTYQDCVIRRMQMDYKSTCGCLGTHLPLPSDLLNDTDVCHRLPEEMLINYNINYRTNKNNFTEYIIKNKTHSYYPLTDYLQANWETLDFNLSRSLFRCYHRVLRRHKTQGVSDKHCPVRCTNTRYRVYSTITSWPMDVNLASEIVRGYVKDNLDQISGTDLFRDRLQYMYDNPNFTFNEVQSLSVLDLYPMSVKTSVFTESFAYPLRNLFSDLGGILGLWVGVSIVTLMEFLELLVQLAQLITKGLVSASKKSGSAQDQAEQSTQRRSRQSIYTVEMAMYDSKLFAESSEKALSFRATIKSVANSD
uniref:Amiloride-sensitive sodium channel n=1 Tax=Macrostomum lignano TaxID=282301 RepID=A0A1I8HRH9_9PLAT